MHPTSDCSSSSSQLSRDPNGISGRSTDGGAAAAAGGGAGTGLVLYRSAPISFSTTTVDSTINVQAGSQQHTLGNHMLAGGSGGGGGGGVTPPRFFSPPYMTLSQLSTSNLTGDQSHTTSFRLNEFRTAFNGLNDTTQISSPLFRHGSSPAGFVNTLVSSTASDGRGLRSSSQLGFSTGTSSFSQISRESDITNSLVFTSSSSHNKRANKIDINGLNILESELNFGLPESVLEAATMEKMMDIPDDFVPCKIRAKRGCATHPRSIAERERRTRISGKLKKLQKLVPSMDKQTSYSDMLDLALQHIKGLQTQVQTLNKELQNCSCGCKPN